MKRINKRGIIIFVVFLILISVIYFFIYTPVKFCVPDFAIDNSQNYIVCEYTESTGYYWRILYDNRDDNKNVYVKLKGNNFDDDGINFFSDRIYYGNCKFVFYGNYTDDESIENRMSEIGEEEGDYKIFEVSDWDIVAPITRLSDNPLNFIFEPKLYLTKKDFTQKDF